MCPELDRRLVLWLLCVPLLLGGTEAAHWLAFRLVYPDAWTRAQVLQQSGHGYLSLLPTVGGAGLAFVVLALLLHGRTARQGASRRTAPTLWQFAALPLIAFVLQEHLESLIAHGTLVGVPLEPTFLPGLALQLPFAAAAYLAARLLLRAAEQLGRSLGAGAHADRRATRDGLVPWFALVLSPARVAVAAAGYAERGPPR